MKDARKILEIISEETRYEILKLLNSSARFLTVQEISEKISKDKKTIDKHLRILLENGLVERKYLENERAYGYSSTRFCNNLLYSIEKAMSLQEPIEMFEKKEETVKVVKRFKGASFLVPIVMIFSALIIGYGHALGLFDKNFLVIERLLIFLTLLSLGLTYLYYTLRGKRIG